MTPARWLAGTSTAILVGTIVWLSNSYFSYLTLLLAVLFGLLAVIAARGREPVDRPALRWVGVMALLFFGPGVFTLATDHSALNPRSYEPIRSAARCAALVGSTAILWLPLAIAVGIQFWRRTGKARSKPLSIATLALRLLACVFAPLGLIAIYPGSGSGLIGYSVFAPVLLLAWFSGPLAWEARGERRRPLLRLYGYLFAVVATTTLLIVGAASTRILASDGTARSLPGHLDGQLFTLSEMGAPLAILMLLYIAMSVWLFKLSEPTRSSN